MLPQKNAESAKRVSGASFLCSLRSFVANLLRPLLSRIGMPGGWLRAWPSVESLAGASRPLQRVCCSASVAARAMFFVLLLSAPFGGFAQSKTDISFGVRLIERKVETGVPEQPEIRFYLRLPEGHAPEKPMAKGVLAFCTWEGEADSLRSRLASDTDELVRYARKRGLALLTWNTATLWKTGKSHSQIGRREFQGQRDDFDKVARAWESGVGKLCKEQNLPQDGYLLYGISRGAHWCGRLALRAPERFLAVHIHVANSYDKPSFAAAQPLWLVSSGDLDRGRDNAVAFYRECRAKGYPMILKVINGLGHANHPEANTLRTEFFDYALRKKERAMREQITPGRLMVAELASSGLTGDVLSQEVYRGADAAKIPEGQRVALPDEKLARAWGFLRK